MLLRSFYHERYEHRVLAYARYALLCYVMSLKLFGWSCTEIVLFTY